LLSSLAAALRKQPAGILDLATFSHVQKTIDNGATAESGAADGGACACPCIEFLATNPHQVLLQKHFQLNPLQRKDVLAAFNHFDADGSGSIDMSELGVAMKSLGFEPRKDDLKAMLGSIDDDENGTINFEEFLSMMTIKISESASRKECDKAFRVGGLNDCMPRQHVSTSSCNFLINAQLLDPKEQGFLTLDNFQDIVSSSGETMTDEEVRLMFQDADLDGDGKVCLPCTMRFSLCNLLVYCPLMLANAVHTVVVAVEFRGLYAVHESHWHFVIIPKVDDVGTRSAAAG